MSSAYFKHSIPVTLLDYEPAILQLAARLEEIDAEVRERIQRKPMLPLEFDQHRTWLGQHAPAIRGSVAQPFVTFSTLLNEFVDIAQDLPPSDLCCLVATLGSVASAQAKNIRDVTDATLHLKNISIQHTTLLATLNELEHAWAELGVLLEHPNREMWELLASTAKTGTWARLSDLARKHLILRVVA